MKAFADNPDQTASPMISHTSSTAFRARWRLMMSLIGYFVAAGLMGAITYDVFGKGIAGILLAQALALPLLREIQRYQHFSRQLKR